MQEIDLGIESGIGHRILYFDEIDSTNTWLKDNADNFAEGTVVWADRQISGRGRMGRQWESPPDVGLYFSTLLKPETNKNHIPLYSLAVSLALKRAIEKYAASYELPTKNINIKRPNDLMISGKKIAGILVEGTVFHDKSRLVVGIGVNITPGEGLLSEEVMAVSSSLTYFFGGMWERRQLLRTVLIELNVMYNDFTPDKIIRAYRNECRIWGHRGMINVGNEYYSGICRDIGENGELILETQEGIKRFISGSLIVKW